MKALIAGALLAGMLGSGAIGAEPISLSTVASETSTSPPATAPATTSVPASPPAPAAADTKALQDAYRASKIIGAQVVNDRDETVGEIDDLLIGRQDNLPYAVLSVGGFLGMGTKLVAVPYQRLKVGPDRILLPGGSKDELEALPEFDYKAS